MIDIEKLTGMLGGDRELAERFIAAFKAEVRRQLPLMREYLEQGDRPMLSDAAHVMKTQTAYLGLEDLSHIAQLIETQAEQISDLALLKKPLLELEEKLISILD